MKSKKFSTEQIEYYSKDPRVKFINEFKLVLKFEFRLKIYEECFPIFTITSIRKALINNGFKTDKIYSFWFSNLANNFKLRKPSGAKNSSFYQPQTCHKIDKDYDNYLLSTGKFEKIRRGVFFTKEFIKEIFSVYPNTTVEDYLESLSYDVSKIGYHRLYKLKSLLNPSNPKDIKISDDDIKTLSTNPYVKRVTQSHFSLKVNFYNESLNFNFMHIDDVLNVFELNPSVIPISSKNRIKYELSHWKFKECDELNIDIKLAIKIENNKRIILEKMVTRGFEVTKKFLKRCSKLEKKSICQTLNDLVYGEDYCYTKREILHHLDISKTSFYSILKDDNYGIYEANREAKELSEIEQIKKVISYSDFKKGSRMIYMMLPRITGITMSRNKILRLCKKANITCSIRKANKSRQAAKRILEEYCQPNHLKRKFKLFKPGYVTLSDVSYLQYNGKKAYLSALKDGCSGKIKLIVSESNDLKLVLDSISDLDNNSNDIRLFHTDQGLLYLNSDFQQKLKDKGFTLSMSKRGNCWDNASQESFFGHLKDECNIQDCASFLELVKLIKSYEYYYNYERPQWNRFKMTPVEYENYINNMSKEEYDKYHRNELTKYEKMMSEATKKAIKRAKDIGIINN